MTSSAHATVQDMLDRMIPALHDWRERGLFTDDEIRAIVTRRTAWETLLTRQPKMRLADAIQYVQDEEKLEQLRALRTKRWQREQHVHDTATANNNNVDHAKRPGDKHVMQHLHLIWQRMLRAHSHDVSLALQYGTWLEQHNLHHRVAQHYATSLQKWPTCVDLWLRSASHAYFRLSNVTQARMLLQRGLRCMSNNDQASKDLWLQSLALELHFGEKMRGRRQVLLLADDDDDDEPVDDDNAAVGPEQAATMSNDNDSAITALPHQLAQIVYDHAVQSHPDDAAWRLAFIDQCQLFSDTEALQTHIWHTLERDLGHQPAAWLARAGHAWERQKTRLQFVGEHHDDETEHDDDNEKAIGFVRTRRAAAAAAITTTGNTGEPSQKKARHHTDATDDKGPVLTVLEQATRQVPNEDTYLQAIDFVQQYMTELEQLLTAAADADARNMQQQVRNQLTASRTFLKDLFADATASTFYSAAIVLAEVDYLTATDDNEQAVQCIVKFVNQHGTTDRSVPLYIRWASLAPSVEEAVDILQRGWAAAWVARPNTRDNGTAPTTAHAAATSSTADQVEAAVDRMELLLELFGASMAAPVSDAQLQEQFDRIMLQAASCDHVDLDDAVFGVQDVVDAALQYMQHLLKIQGVHQARHVYTQVLFHTSLPDNLLAQQHVDRLQKLLDGALVLERRHAKDTADHVQRVHRLQERARRLLEGTPAVVKNRHQREMMARGSDAIGRIDYGWTIPAFQWDTLDVGALEEAFRVYRVAMLRNVVYSNDGRRITPTDIGQLFESLQADKKSFCVETPGSAGANDPARFFQGSSRRVRGYCSFVVQTDAEVLNTFVSKLPLAAIPASTPWTHENAVWVFFGRNGTGVDDLEGRGEHTDSITHDGTWHYQLSGEKVWHLRPTKSLANRWTGPQAHAVSVFDSDLSQPISVRCQRDDVIVIDTSLWFHRTTIPVQPCPSISYARDFHCNDRKTIVAEVAGMSNVDGLYAVEEIAEGDILFTQNDLPDCQLPCSSTNANCELVEDVDGTRAVIALRPIKMGEFFCLYEDSSESDGEQAL